MKLVSSFAEETLVSPRDSSAPGRAKVPTISPTRTKVTRASAKPVGVPNIATVSRIAGDKGPIQFSITFPYGSPGKLGPSILLPVPRGQADKFEARLVAAMRLGKLRDLERTLIELQYTALPEVTQESRAKTVPAWREAEAGRWAEMRSEWLKNHDTATAAVVAKIASSRSHNPSALLNGWVRAKRIFALQDGAVRLYPLFQLDEAGQPKEVFRKLLETTADKLEGWPLAVWLTTPNAEFEGWRTPLEMLDEDPDAVVAAAKLEIEEPLY